ncbi:baseplate J/gp47 family protein [Xenorhabdus bovienii]|uniref:baseplate J/gp47 family protein n=1 Tax=Xenorhabdus bovienii TaxID=40576 RepID=UPI0023B2152C|nr:baseplate J/gp47 family protein [Xenorhabdus bovienii]MDE9495704.1 baseplate J/gp47 family protein [Xenorhabdus bovienii]MDE9504107.1 baseplate J/gp47 family protein [Xenorhabdus bovienii]MDE9570993.1 baseplate J/gp47 family protein [Xenorhabdus bovienii]
MLQITDTGIVIEQLSVIHQRLEAGFRRIYGEDINLDADSPDGQIVGLFSQELANINQVIAVIVQMLDPYNATGAWLEQRAMYAGLVRRGAEFSYLDDVIITGNAGVTVPAGTVLTDDNRVKWITLIDATLNNNGSAQVKLCSQELGSFTLQPNKELKMETVIVGVEKTITTKEAKAGGEEETDGNFLLRFMRSHSINNHDDRQGIEAALLNLPDAKQARVYENFTNQTDVRGIPPHSMNAVVIGGRDEDIALTILRKKVGGCGLMGNISHSCEYSGAERIVRFDRAEMVSISVKIVIDRINGFQDIDTDGIKSALAATEFTIGESVYAMRLTCRVNTISGFYIKSIMVNGSDSASIGVRQCAQIKPENVEVLIE